MLIAKANILGLVLVLLVLSACLPDTAPSATDGNRPRSGQAVPVTLPPTRTMIAMETGTAVSQTPPTPVPTTTSTPTATQTDEPTKTPLPINPPQPTATFTGRTLTLNTYDLPAWIVDPNVNVLIVGSYSDNLPATIINVDTGEQHKISGRERQLTPSWLWQEDNQVVSPDGRYATHVTREDRFDIVTLVDQETGLETELYNPFQISSRDDYNVYATTHWSPDGALLAVEYEKHYYDDNYDLDLAIYTPSGELFRQYANMSTSWNNPWAPGLPYRILFTEGSSPCILIVIENSQTCLETIAEWKGNKSVWNFTWSPDGSKISFLHYSEEEGDNGLCYVELVTEEIFCPITPDDLLLEEQMVPRAYFWSPDGRYLALFFDDLWPGDVVGPLEVAVVNSDGQNFQILGQNLAWPYDNPWRPSIPSTSQE